MELKDELHQMRTQTEVEIKERRQELTQLENRLLSREEALDEMQKDMTRREQSVTDREAHYRKVLDEVESLRTQEEQQLQEIAGLTKEQAAEVLLKHTEDEVRHDMARMVRAIEEEARHEGERRAKDILSVCIQRTASSHVGPARCGLGDACVARVASGRRSRRRRLRRAVPPLVRGAAPV